MKENAGLTLKMVKMSSVGSINTIRELKIQNLGHCPRPGEAESAFGRMAPLRSTAVAVVADGSDFITRDNNYLTCQSAYFKHINLNSVQVCCG